MRHYLGFKIYLSKPLALGDTFVMLSLLKYLALDGKQTNPHLIYKY